MIKVVSCPYNDCLSDNAEHDDVFEYIEGSSECALTSPIDRNVKVETWKCPNCGRFFSVKYNFLEEENTLEFLPFGKKEI